jgi:predicted DNA-binding antitoxin AbrB/MazE fold protein
MTTAVRAIYEGGVFKPKEPVHLAEKTEVEVLIPGQPELDSDDPTGWKAIDSLSGIIKDAPADVSEEHDRYLYHDPQK